MKKIILAGEVPYVAVIAFAAVSYYVGQQMMPTEPKVAIAERGALIFQAVLERQGASREVLDAEVSQPVRAVLKKYADLGYVVIDASKDDAGNYVVAALPQGAIDISKDIASAIKKPATPQNQESPAGAK